MHKFKKRNSSNASKEQNAKKEQNGNGWDRFQILSTHLAGFFKGLCWGVVWLLLSSLLVSVWFGPMELASVVELAKSYLTK